MNVVQIDKDETDWDSFVETAEQATGYHRFRWRSIIGQSFGHACYYFAASMMPAPGEVCYRWFICVVGFSEIF